jgi:hypothetical protein
MTLDPSPFLVAVRNSFLTNHPLRTTPERFICLGLEKMTSPTAIDLSRS